MSDCDQTPNNHYPDPVLKAFCRDCDGFFYHHGDGDKCPYCGSESVRDGQKGVVRHI